MNDYTVSIQRVFSEEDENKLDYVNLVFTHITTGAQIAKTNIPIANEEFGKPMIPGYEEMWTNMIAAIESKTTTWVTFLDMNGRYAFRVVDGLMFEIHVSQYGGSVWSDFQCTFEINRHLTEALHSVLGMLTEKKHAKNEV